MYVSCRASQMWYLDQAPTQFGARAAGKKRTLEPDADMGLDDLETPAAKRITNSVFAEETAFGGPDFSRWHPGRRDSCSGRWMYTAWLRNVSGSAACIMSLVAW